MYSFGRDIAYKLYTTEDGIELAPLPNQTITAYVFREQVSREDSISGDGAIATITYSHLLATHANIIQFTIPAIDDPFPNTITQIYYYWISINFVIKTGEQVQTITRSLPMSRAVGHDKTIGVTASQIVNIYPDVYQYLSEDQVTSIIAMASKNLVNDLKNKGYAWANIHRPDQLYDALLFKSLDYVYASQVQRQGDKFAFLYEKAKQSYESIIANLNLSFDDSLAGAQTSQIRPSGIILGVR